MEMKYTNIGIRKRVWVMSIALLMLALVIIPTPNSVVTGTATVNMDLKAGWNLKGMPESISASDLALKSNYITSVVHRNSEGYYITYIPSLGVTDFTLEVNEGVYIYSEADTIILFTISPSNGYLGGDLTVTGDLDVTGDSIIDNDLRVLGSLSIVGDFEVNNLNVTEDLIVDGNLKANENLAVGKDLTVDGNLIVGKDLSVGNLTITEDMTINDDLTVTGDATIYGDSTVAGDMEVLGKLTAGDFTVSNLTISEDLSINGNLTVLRKLTVGEDIAVTGDMAVGNDLTVTGDTLIEGNLNVMGDAIIAGKLTAGDFTVGNLTIAEDLSINGDLFITGDATIGGNLTVTDDITIEGDYTVTEDLTVGGDLFVTGNITGLALGDMVNYVIGRDETGVVYARNGLNGNLDFQSTNASYVLQSAIEAVNKSSRQGGVIYLRKADYWQPYNIPGRYGVMVDYVIDYTIGVPDGISILSDGALLKVTNLNGTVFKMNPEGKGYNSNHLTWKISGLAFVGDNDNTETCAIQLIMWQHTFIIDNIHTEHINYPVKIEGEAYRTVVQNSLFIGGSGALGQMGEIGVWIYKGTHFTPPNGVTIINCDISSFKDGIRVDEGYGIRIIDNYFEGGGFLGYIPSDRTPTNINLSGGWVTVMGNYIQVYENGWGIYLNTEATITANQFVQGNTAYNSYGIYAVGGKAVISSNRIATDTYNTTFFFSPDSQPAVTTNIVGNMAVLKGGGVVTTFIDAKLTASLVSSNEIREGDPAIRQRQVNPSDGNLYTGNHFYNAGTAMNVSGKDHIVNNYFRVCNVDIILHGPYNRVSNNHLSGTVETIETSDMGGGNIIEYNIGYVTENGGVALSVVDGTWVSHGLSSTPLIVILSPQSDVNVWVMARDDTQFQIGVSAGTVTVDWYAEVR
jgi:predicted acyltransferase (DUF342 family)